MFLPGTTHCNLAVAQLFDALRYKPEGRGFDSRWGHWDIFDLILPADCTVALWSSHTLTEMSTWDVSWG